MSRVLKDPFELVGVGLRPRHYPYLLENSPRIGFFEAISENYMDSGGRPRYVLKQIAERYPMALHGVSLSIASADPLNENYLASLSRLIREVDPLLVSDHLCWTGVQGLNTHDLLPMPLNEESLRHVVERIEKVQDRLGRRLVLENISTYLSFKNSDLFEADFVAEAIKRSGASLLLDINNVWVNSYNHNFDVHRYFEALKGVPIAQYHISGHTDMGDYLFDTHQGPTPDKVWDLYALALKNFGFHPTLIEWDTAIPEWSELEAEVEKARQIVTKLLREGEFNGT